MNKEYAKQIINQATPTFIGQQLVNANTVANTFRTYYTATVVAANQKKTNAPNYAYGH